MSTQVYIPYYTQAEYVSMFDRKYTSLSVGDSLDVKVYAVKLAEEDKIKPKQRSGSKANARRKTITLPKSIWKEAYEKFEEDEA